MGFAEVACLAVAAAIAALAAPGVVAADSGVPAPLKQAGVGAADMLCNAGRVLLVSPGGAPACVFGKSAGALAGRGWLEMHAGGGEGGVKYGAGRGGQDPAASASGSPELRPAGKDRVASAPHPVAMDGGAAAISGRADGAIAAAPAHPNIYHNNLTISKYPVVGEVADVTFTVTLDRDDWLGESSPPAKLLVGVSISGRGHPDRIFDVVSNIGTGDPDVFMPYDPDNVTTVVRLGETYTVKAKFDILEEGFVTVYGLGLDGDVVRIYIAASKNVSMNTYEYLETGQTYLDHTRATGQGETTTPPPEPDYGVSVPDHVVDRTAMLETHRPWYSMLAEGFVDLGYTEDQMVDELFYWGYLRPDIRKFFVHVMNYTEEEADAVRMGDDLLGGAYMAVPTNVNDIVRDMLERRNYTAAEARDLLRDHMFYTDEEAAALVLNATAALGSAAAGPGVPAPLKQAGAGVGAADILCNAGRVLLVSPGGAPACVFAESAGALAGRGWLEVHAGDGEGGVE